jgi:hypothetical protein
MKALLVTTGLLLAIGMGINTVKAQSYEAERLMLDAEKLTQLKSILSDMKEGYNILTKGYEEVKNISQGNFNLHQLFLDGLLKVSPAVSNYKRVADIIAAQLQLTKEYKTALNKFRQDNNFSVEEINYISSVYNNLISASLGNLDDLMQVISEGVLRMSDEERLERIDDVYKGMQDKLTFLRSFNNHNSILALQRAKEKNNISALQNIYNLK